MKQVFFVAIISLITCATSYAQDLIVTTKGDSINCKINKEKSDFIYFTYNNNDEVRETLLARNNIKSYQKNYYSESFIPEGYKSVHQEYTKVRFSANGGFSFRTAKISKSVPSDLRNYVKDLKSGGHFSLDGAFFINPNIGLGFKYNQFSSSNKIDAIVTDYDQDGNNDYGSMSDNITISFFGPMISTYSPSANKRNALFSNFAIGYLSYKDEGEFIIPVQLKGNSLGLIGDLGYQFGLNNNLSLAFTLSYTLGTLSKLDKTIQGSTYKIELEDGNYENLSRIDLSIGLVFHK